MIHVDFMIGAPDMEITGYKNGVATPIFVNGEWANN
jgi:aminopeptidase